MRGRGLHRGLAFRHLCLFAHLLIGHVVHRHLRLCGVLLFVLALFGRGFGILLILIVLTGAVGFLFVVRPLFGLVFLILFGEFRSVRIALLVMVNLPLALIGGVAALLLSDGVLSVASLVGFVTLFGVATRNGVLLISYYQRLQEPGLPLREAVGRGAAGRRPRPQR